MVTAALATLLVVDTGGIPAETVDVGDVATRTVKAPFTFSFPDFVGHVDARARARAAAPPVFVHEEGIVDALGAQVGAAFQAGRDALDGVTVADDAAPEARAEAEAAAKNEALQAFAATLEGRLGGREAQALAAAGFPRAAEAMITDWLEQAYDGRLVVAERAALPEASGPVRVVTPSGEVTASSLEGMGEVVEPDAVRRVVTLEALREKSSLPWVDAAEALALSLVRPSLTFDAARTAAAADAAEAAVSADLIVVKRGETLFREGDKIDARQRARYVALQATRADRSALLGVVVTFGFLLLVYGALVVAGSELFDDEEGTRDLAALGGTLVTVVALSRIVVAAGPGIAGWLRNDAMPESMWFLAPVAGGTMLIRTLIGPTRAAGFAVAVVATLAVLMELDATYVLFFLLTSLVAGVMVPNLRERAAVLAAGFRAGLVGAALVLLVHLVELLVTRGELSLAMQIRPLWSMAAALLGGVVSGFFVLAVLPVFEWLGYATDHRMLELARYDHPLLRQLAVKADGTYHHSVMVGTLAEAACEAIGANALQAKVSAYFHDIGKALKPRYFVENQRGGPNPHSSLDPVTSAEIIIGHVTEGARMAREHRLPKPILDNILMHHGTGLLQYFFAKAQMEAKDPAAVDESTFRYPGPKPSTREAGVIMLADKVEAATRTIRHKSEENIRAMINRIINSVIADHQFTECPLTFQEIHTIADVFTQRLVSIYHDRIEYPQTQDLSRGGAPASARSAAAPEGEQGRIAGRAGTITLELETRALEPVADEDLWNDVAEETDETTDYESIRNLPQGDL